jgi:hypothetical protein
MNFILGSQDNLPSDVLNNKGQPIYHFFASLIGLMYHYKIKRKRTKTPTTLLYDP